jgi:hypothetical protein
MYISYISQNLRVPLYIYIKLTFHGFLMLQGSKYMKGIHCRVALYTGCTPPPTKSLGGIGVPNLQYLNILLRTHWFWFKRTKLDEPWREFNILASGMRWEFFTQQRDAILETKISLFSRQPYDLKALVSECVG